MKRTSIDVLYIASEAQAEFLFPQEGSVFQNIQTWGWKEQPLTCGFVGDKLVHLEPCECDWDFEVGRDGQKEA